MEQLQADTIKWLEETVPTDKNAIFFKLDEEIQELIFAAEYDDRQSMLEEIADVQILLWYAAHLNGIDIPEAVKEKMQVNRSRTYHKRPDGTWKHD